MRPKNWVKHYIHWLGLYKRSCLNCNRQIDKQICEYCGYDIKEAYWIHPGEGLSGHTIKNMETQSVMKICKIIKRKKRCIVCNVIVPRSGQWCPEHYHDHIKQQQQKYGQAKAFRKLM